MLSFPAILSNVKLPAQPAVQPPAVPPTDPRASGQAELIPKWANLAALIAGLGTNLLEIWDADVLASFTLVTVDHISAWVGQKNAISLAQGTDARRPQYLPTGWNGKPSVFYEGTVLRNLVTTSFAIIPTGATPFEVWVMADQPDVAGTKVILQWPNNTAGQNVALSYFKPATGNRVIVGGNTGAANVSVNVSDSFLGKHIVRGQWLAGLLSGGMDGSYPANRMATIAEALASAATGTFALGSQSSNGAFWGGSLRKVLITKPLTDIQAASLYNYLVTQL